MRAPGLGVCALSHLGTGRTPHTRTPLSPRHRVIFPWSGVVSIDSSTTGSGRLHVSHDHIQESAWGGKPRSPKKAVRCRKAYSRKAYSRKALDPTVEKPICSGCTSAPRRGAQHFFFRTNAPPHFAKARATNILPALARTGTAGNRVRGARTVPISRSRAHHTPLCQRECARALPAARRGAARRNGVPGSERPPSRQLPVVGRARALAP